MLTKLLEYVAKVETLCNAVKDIIRFVEWYASGDIDSNSLIRELDEHMQNKTAKTVAVKEDVDMDMLHNAMQNTYNSFPPLKTSRDELAQSISEALAEMFSKTENTE